MFMTTSKRGRPKRETRLDEQQVEYLASIGVTDADIAILAGVSESTVRRRFDTQLKTGRVSLRTRLRKAMVDSALSGNVTMQIWLSKQFLGMRDKQDVAFSGRDVREMTDEELRAIVDRKD